jgi:hypothetical protein
MGPATPVARRQPNPLGYRDLIDAHSQQSDTLAPCLGEATDVLWGAYPPTEESFPF